MSSSRSFAWASSPQADGARPVFPDAPLPRLGGRGVVAVLLLAATCALYRREVLFYPPFQDQATGYWTEADFLAETGFDYYKLRYGVNHYMEFPPGPRSYMICITPTLMAIVMKSTSNIDAQIFIAKMLSFLCGAMIVVVFYRIARAWMDVWGAALLSGLLISLPLFIPQVEIMGMDVPVALTMLLSWAALVQHRIAASVGWGILAFAFKATGMLSLMVAATYLALLLLLGWRGRNASERAGLSGWLVLHVSLLAVLWMLVQWLDTTIELRSAFQWPHVAKPPYSILTLTPELGLLMLIGAGLATWRILRVWRRRREPALDERLFQVLWAERAGIVAWITIIGLLATNWLVMYIPRYVYCIVPIIVVAVANGLQVAGPVWKWWKPATVALIAFNLANVEGRFYPPVQIFGEDDFDRIPGMTKRLCMFTERSREYLRDHRSTIAGIRKLVESHPDDPIFVAAPYRFFMGSPALGYVPSPLRVFDSTRFEQAIGHFLDLYAPLSGEPEAADPIFVYYGDGRVAIPRPEPEDEVIYRDSLDPPLLIYRKRLPRGLRGDRGALESWYIEKNWSPVLVSARFSGRAAYLLKREMLPQVEMDLKRALAMSPSDPRLLAWKKALDGR